MEWLDQEVFLDPPQGEPRHLDLLAKLRAAQPVAGERANQGDAALARMQVEIESAATAQPVRPRMYEHYDRTRGRHGLPVLPIALYLRVGLIGIGIDVYEESFHELRVLQFQYYYVGLPGLPAENYVAS